MGRTNTTRIHALESDRKKYFVMLQTDKLVYKFKELINYHVLVMDSDMRPYNFKRLEVLLSDGKKFNETQTCENDNRRICQNSFRLSTNQSKTWTLNVKVDGESSSACLFIEIKSSKEPNSTSPEYIIETTSIKKFLTPGRPYLLRVQVKNSDGALIKGEKDVTLDVRQWYYDSDCSVNVLRQGILKTKINRRLVMNGAVEFEMDIPFNIHKLRVRVTFENSSIYKDIFRIPSKTRENLDITLENSR